MNLRSSGSMIVNEWSIEMSFFNELGYYRFDLHISKL